MDPATTTAASSSSSSPTASAREEEKNAGAVAAESAALDVIGMCAAQCKSCGKQPHYRTLLFAKDTRPEFVCGACAGYSAKMTDNACVLCGKPNDLNYTLVGKSEHDISCPCCKDCDTHAFPFLDGASQSTLGVSIGMCALRVSVEPIRRGLLVTKNVFLLRRNQSEAGTGCWCNDSGRPCRLRYQEDYIPLVLACVRSTVSELHVSGAAIPCVLGDLDRYEQLRTLVITAPSDGGEIGCLAGVHTLQTASIPRLGVSALGLPCGQRLRDLTIEELGEALVCYLLEFLRMGRPDCNLAALRINRLTNPSAQSLLIDSLEHCPTVQYLQLAQTVCTPITSLCRAPMSLYLCNTSMLCINAPEWRPPTLNRIHESVAQNRVRALRERRAWAVAAVVTATARAIPQRSLWGSFLPFIPIILHDARVDDNRVFTVDLPALADSVPDANHQKHEDDVKQILSLAFNADAFFNTRYVHEHSHDVQQSLWRERRWDIGIGWSWLRAADWRLSDPDKRKPIPV